MNMNAAKIPVEENLLASPFGVESAQRSLSLHATREGGQAVATPSPLTRTRQSSRIRSLDGLRAVAIVLVLAMHLHSLPGATWSPWLSAIAIHGQFGVEVFFVLSGFLITMLLLKEEQADGRIDLRMFYIRRAFRILPPAMTYLLVITLLAAVGIAHFTRDLLTSALFVRNLFPDGNSDTGHFWSLAIEEQFYLVWPLLLVVLPRKMRIATVCALVIALPIFRHEYYRIFPHATLVPFEIHYDGLLIGSLLALVGNHVRMRSLLRSPGLTSDATILAAVAAIILLLSPLAARLGTHVRDMLTTVLSLLVALVVNAIVHRQSGWVSTLLAARPMVLLGVLSYSLYLWQQLFCYDSASLMLPAPWCLLCAIAAATASYWLIERPSLRLRHRWFPASNS